MEDCDCVLQQMFLFWWLSNKSWDYVF